MKYEITIDIEKTDYDGFPSVGCKKDIAQRIIQMFNNNGISLVSFTINEIKEK